jgi:hypothetical protein
MYSRITKIYRKTVGHVFTKPVQIEGTTQKILSPVSYFSSQFTFLPLGDASVCSEKMAVPEEKSFCVLEYHTSKSVVSVQRAFHAKYAKVFVPPLTRDLADIKRRIIAAVKNIDAPMLTCLWQELEYRVNVCHVTRGANIEHL